MGSEKPPEELGQEVRLPFSKPSGGGFWCLVASAGALMGLVLLIAASLAVVWFVVIWEFTEHPSSVKSPASIESKSLQEDKPKQKVHPDDPFEQLREILQRYLDAKARGDFEDEVKVKGILADLRNQSEKAFKDINLKLILIGVLPFILTAAGLLVFPVSLVLLGRYRRAVRRSMLHRTGAAPSVSRGGDIHAPPSPWQAAPLRIVDLGETGSSSVTPAAQPISTRVGRAPWRAAAVYCLGGVCFAGIMAAAFFAATRIAFSPIWFVALVWTYGWPLVLALALVVGSTIRTRLMTVLAYLGVLVLIGIVDLALSPQHTIKSIGFLWLNFNAAPTALVLVCLTRRVRAVGPLVLIFLLIACAGMAGWTFLVGFYFFRVVDLSVSLGLGYYGSFLALIGLLFIIIAACAALGWLLLKWIRAGYKKKKISDQSLTLDSLWLIFGIVYSIDFAAKWPGWMASGLLAFLTYKLVVATGFATVKGEVSGSGVRLLLLRVFSLGRRCEKLFSALGIHWRYVGSIQMIAGPDLATTTIEPHEFLDFLVGRLARLFIGSQKTLDHRLSEMDLKRDRDWRYRVNHFFCLEDNWKLVLHRLASESDTVLMDLRSFSPERAGCIFEISELVNCFPLDRVIFLVDGTTDKPFLRRTIEQSWHELRSNSPNYQAPYPQLRLFHYKESDSRSLHQLLSTISAAARPTGQLPQNWTSYNEKIGAPGNHMN